MRCEEARAILRQRGDGEAESHLEACPTCFAWLEERDPLVEVLRAAAPTPVAAPATLAQGVLRRRQVPRVSWRLGLAAAGGLGFLAVMVLWIGLVSAPAVATALLVDAENALSTTVIIVGALLAAPRALLLDNPFLLAVYLSLTVAVCAVWVRLYQQIPAPRRAVR